MNWKALIAGLVLGLAPALLCPAPACAAEGKDRAKKSDPAAEAKEAAQEDADEIETSEIIRSHQRDLGGREEWK